MFLLKLKFIIPLALVTALLATLGAYSYLQTQKRALEQNHAAMLPVVIAKIDLPAGSKLEESLLEARLFPAALAPEGSFKQISELAGRIVKSDIYAGEALLASRLAAEGSGSGVSAVIPPGMRAMTVAVNVVSGVSGFILPHARVDVLATVSATLDKEESSTTTILENIEVLAVDQTVTPKDDDPITVKSVTLLVNPAQAEKLALASSEGKLQLVLRNTADQQTTVTAGVSLKELINKNERPSGPARPSRAAAAPAPAPREEPAKEPPKQVIEVYRSSTRSEVVLEEGKATEKKPQK
ncbi:MAG TPA: Flp pilus assembly protein CpaB [bacterium]|nr:Flp pilus assembly protein CpaB [bacterium]HOC88474.1 Flp pilus assembly protein CpaB [bacterium]HOZ20738.1 Flp pilus assembly protein CpaB [bacterium]